MIIVTAPLWVWPGEKASGHFVSVPAEQSGEIRAHSLLSRGGFGSVKVEATINDVTWRTSVFPMKSGGYILPVKKDVRVKADVVAADEVTVQLELL